MLPKKIELPSTITEVKAKELTALFTPMLQQMEELEIDYNEIVDMPIGKKTCELAKKLRLKYVKIRTGTKTLHKEAKAYHVAAGKAVDAFKNAQLFAGQGNEERLKTIETFFERREQEKIDMLHDKRLDILIDAGMEEGERDTATLGTMDEDIFQYLLGQVVETKAKREQAEKEETERRRLADLEALKARDEKIRADERAKVEREAEQKKAEQVKQGAEEFAEEFNVPLSLANEQATPRLGEELKAEAEYKEKTPTSFRGTGALTGDKKGSHANPDFEHATRGFDYNFKVTLRVVAATEEEADEMIRELIDENDSIIDSEQY